MRKTDATLYNLAVNHNLIRLRVFNAILFQSTYGVVAERLNSQMCLFSGKHGFMLLDFKLDEVFSPQQFSYFTTHMKRAIEIERITFFDFFIR